MRGFLLTLGFGLRRGLFLGLLPLGAACGVASSGAGAPTHPPASGLGPIVPLEDSAGLSWTAPFLLADPSRALSHPNVPPNEPAQADRLELWAESDQGGERSIVFARAESFETGMGPLEEALGAELAWEGGAVGSPAVLRDETTGLLLYVAAGQIGCARLAEGRGEARAAAPVYTDAGGGLIRSIAFGRAGDHVRGFALIEGPLGVRVDALAGSFAALARAVSAPAAGAALLRARPGGLVLPGWAIGATELGVRLEPTPAGRLREDLFFAATLPQLGDLGVDAAQPSAIGAATRYLDGPLRDDVGLSPSPEAPLETVAAPILSGPPSPTSATAVAYRGGVLVLYSARSGPRTAIGVGRHP